MPTFQNDSFIGRSDLQCFETRSFPVETAGTDTFVAGDWAEVNADGNKVKKNGDAVPALAYLVVRGTAQPDTEISGPSVLIGPPGFVFDTTRFDAHGTYTVGKDLTVKNGVLTDAAEGEKVYAVCVIPPAKSPIAANEWIRAQTK